jgi:cytoskeletal protein RodZ
MRNSMRNFILNIQRKSEGYKKRFALIVSALLTLIIFFVWSVSFYSQVAVTNDTSQTDNQTVDSSQAGDFSSQAAVSSDDQSQSVQSVQSVQSASVVGSVSPFSTTFDAVKQSFNNLKEGLSSLYSSVVKKGK